MRILPLELKDEEANLIRQGLMSLPKAELPEDCWVVDAPDVAIETVVAAIRAERDED